MENTGLWRVVRATALVAVTLLAPSCGPGESAGPPPPLEPVAEVHDLMHDLIYPHAEVFWDSVGTIIDMEGTHEIRPGNEDQWETVVQSALTVAEAGNLLMLEGRARDAGPWLEHATALREAATRGLEAARNRDADAVFEIGGDVYYACNGCHEDYWENPPSAMRP